MKIARIMNYLPSFWIKFIYRQIQQREKKNELAANSPIASVVKYKM